MDAIKDAIKTAWRGGSSLSDVFWWGFVGPLIFFLVIEIPLFWFIAMIVNYFSVAAFLILAIKSPWYLWCVVSLANTAKKLENRKWAIAAAVTVVVCFILNIMSSVAIVDGLSRI